MGHTLTFAAVHKSITGLVPVELPPFTVLTGRNGSGKTHLLTAIAEGKVLSSLIGDYKTETRFFDWNSIVPKDTGVFDPWKDASKRSQWFTQIQAQRENTFPNIQQYVISLGVPANECASLRYIDALSVERLRELLAQPKDAEQVHAQIRARLKAFGVELCNFSISHIGDNMWRSAAPKIRDATPETFVFSSSSELFRDPNFLWGEVDAFQQAFGKVFTTYRELLHDNALLEKFPPSKGLKQRHLSDSEFLASYGEPPWIFVNRILEECKLDFRVDHPPLHETGAYEPKLTKLTSSVEMKFEDLSSGERVLMSFALCLYNTEDKRQSKVFPKLLLLDEVDAPLHPSMTASLLKTIINVLVKGKGVAVILTTHSPSTVALAPEEALYSMNPVGPLVEKVTKGAALSLLTTGVPTLSVSFSGRRQVFVESGTDAEIHDALYQKYKSQIQSERSLQFVEVGRRDESGGERNAGVDQVNRLVDALATGGNQSVLGLVDWDGARGSTKRVHVLSPKSRDGLENLVLDPLLIFSLVVRENVDFARGRGFVNPEETYINLANWDDARWQRGVDAVQAAILPEPASAVQRVRYLSGVSLHVRADYLCCDDHLLEERVKEAFGFLIPRAKRRGDLMRHVISTVLTDFPRFLPLDLIETYELLLNCEIE